MIKWLKKILREIGFGGDDKHDEEYWEYKG